jgi:hypothetical protein
MERLSPQDRLTPRQELLEGPHIAEIARQAEERAKELLNRHSDLIGPGLGNIIAQRESIFAIEEYKQRRYEGLENDSSSEKPGITTYVTPLGRDEILETCRQEGYPIPDYQIEELTPDLIALRLPRGVYGTGRLGLSIQFYQEASYDWENSSMASKPFVLHPNSVVRIEGDNNELWQNAAFQWNGAPKPPESR